MKVISRHFNENNTRITIEFTESGVLSLAGKYAEQHGCGFSHNVKIKPLSNHSFGSISFNKGNHVDAALDFINAVNKQAKNSSSH